jgi:CheY-like chemotaxis protein
MNDNRPIEILLAEDSPSDQDIVKQAFKTSKLRNRLHTVWNGEEVLAFLRREGQYADAPTPDLILLDMNMPRKDGRETLAEIKQHERWKFIPVVVLTASQAERDIMTAYGLHANCYIIKPVDFGQIIEVVHSIESFWFTIVKLPHVNDS